jgi:hypothetical protein
MGDDLARTGPAGAAKDDHNSRSPKAKSGQEARSNGSEFARPEGDDVAGEIRVAKYDYVPQEQTGQIALKANDLVRVFEVTESGWAAGVRLSKRNKEEVGEPGWFPAAYLAPAGHSAAEAA